MYTYRCPLSDNVDMITNGFLELEVIEYKQSGYLKICFSSASWINNSIAIPLIRCFLLQGKTISGVNA